jgi:lysozyme
MIIQVGSQGENVKKIQIFLGITADGIFGKGTEDAVKKWQLTNNLVPDGIIGDLTWSKMGFENPSLVANMKTSEVGINLIKQFEGCSLIAYNDPGTGGVPITIGYGNTYYENGDLIKLGDVITSERANSLLLFLLPQYENIIKKNIIVGLNQNQFDSLVSFVWNTGGSNTLYDLINKNSSHSDIYTFWTTHYITAGGKVLAGLVKRRKKEAELFCV